MKRNKFIVFFLCAIILFVFMGGCNNDKTDYALLINEITQNKMSANIKIEVYNKSIISGENLVAEGSGVIYDIKETSGQDNNVVFDYYLLTNNHVVSIDVDNVKIFYLYDYQGFKYKGELVAVNSSADLGVLKFSTTNVLSKIEFADSLPNLNAPIFTVGSPKSQNNAITVGKYLGLIDAPEINSVGSSIHFQVIKHSAIIKEGSSGSMLLDENLRLIGINYAGVTNTETKEFLNSLAIPFSRVNEFLQSVD